MVFLHQLQQFEDPVLHLQEVFVQHPEVRYMHFIFVSTAHIKNLPTGFQVGRITVEEMGRGTKPTLVDTPHSRDENAGISRPWSTHDLPVKGAVSERMLDRFMKVFLKEFSQVVHPFTLADEIMIDHGFDIGNIDSVSPEDDLGFRRQFSNGLRHLSGLFEIGNNETDSDVIVSLFHFFPESRKGWKIQDR